MCVSVFGKMAQEHLEVLFGDRPLFGFSGMIGAFEQKGGADALEGGLMRIETDFAGVKRQRQAKCVAACGDREAT